MVTPVDIKHWIEAGLDGAQVEIDGDGHHFNAVIVCPAFAGKSMIQQHQMVYDALGGQMGETLHALALQTNPPKDT